MSMANSVERRGTGVPVLRKVLAFAAILIAALATALAVGAVPAWASPNLQSTGSSFASVAIQQWVGQSSTLYGLNINWQVSSSVQGLNDFALNQVDFGASDIPYSSGQAADEPNQPYQYMPDVAGGLAFMYNLTGNDGQRITNLNLNASVIGKIFLGEITSWDDPAIVALNPQLAGDLPSNTSQFHLTPVYRTDASGENYLLTDYLLHLDGPDILAAQHAFLTEFPGQPNATWPTPQDGANESNYPGFANGYPQGEQGSDAAANYVASATSDGSITYVETAYAIVHHFPVANLINASNHAVQPTSVNVATAMVAAILHPDLTQDLTNVYTDIQPNAYPLSAYSYLVTPCNPSLGPCDGPGGSSPLAPDKGQAIGQFVSFLACAGQQQMALLGYSPLPPNLVDEDFDAVGRLNGGQQPPPATAANCKNPYVDGQTQLPGEPVVVGQAGGGVVTPTTTASTGTTASSGTAGAAGSTGAGASAGAGAGGSSGPGSSAGSTSSSGSAGATGLTAAQIAAGDTVVNGHVVQKPCTGAKRFLCADALTAATTPLASPSVGLYVGWAVLILALLIGPPLIALNVKRRRQEKAGA
jgi:phosphate transport system substrate-binding protein